MINQSEQSKEVEKLITENKNEPKGNPEIQLMDNVSSLQEQESISNKLEKYKKKNKQQLKEIYYLRAKLLKETEQNETTKVENVEENELSVLKKSEVDIKTEESITTISVIDEVDDSVQQVPSEENPHKIEKIQALLRRFIDKRKYRRYRKKLFTARELLSTEETYISGLLELQSRYMIPLKEQGILDDQKISSIFSKKELEIILIYNQQLRSQLLNIVNDDFNYYTAIGKVIDGITKYFKVYTVYVNFYETAISLLTEELKKNERFRRFFDDDGLSLQSSLVLPIQRPPRYVMLLKDLVKNTHSSHPDYVSLEKCLESMENVANYINNRKAEADSQIQVTNVVNSLIARDSRMLERFREIAGKPSRRYLFDAELLCQIGWEKKKIKHVFCFNDLLIFTKPGHKNSYKYLSELEIDQETVLETRDDSLSILLSAGEEDVCFTFDEHETYSQWSNGLSNTIIILKRALNSRNRKSQQKKTVSEEDTDSSASTNLTWSSARNSFHSALSDSPSRRKNSTKRSKRKPSRSGSTSFQFLMGKKKNKKEE
eukprot:TRINITY_DN2757_c0_g1_i1.p1 TRINITY_DN2757_c0_g1~~TRINITY_DN2757_c0_g1_i1.p1  ORF type:complete len:609 (-),score=139.79 TRINITY_DN2757_c0_g1_i1:53-1687(-)